MRKRFFILIAICVCALTQLAAHAQSLDSLPETPAIANGPDAASLPSASLSVSELRAKLDEARALLKSHANSVNDSTVALAVLDRETGAIELITVSKDSFLTKGAHLSVTSQSGRALDLYIVRANGVNTAVRVTEGGTGTELTPLTVAFPIVKGGALTEVAYYNSAHPALVSDHVATAGEDYINSMLDH